MQKVNHVNPELQDEIMKWMMENRYCFNRLGNCMDEFKEYIFSTETGEYLIGGTAVSDFIHTIDAAMNSIPMKYKEENVVFLSNDLIDVTLSGDGYKHFIR